MAAEHVTPLTQTEQALEDEGVSPTQHYALRADQLADGSFHYALEDAAGQVIVEAAHVDAHEALTRFENALGRSGLSKPEIEALRNALTQYDHATPDR